MVIFEYNVKVNWEFWLSLFLLCTAMGVAGNMLFLFARLTPYRPDPDNKYFLVFTAAKFAQVLVILIVYLGHWVGTERILDRVLLTELRASTTLFLLDVFTSLTFTWFSLSYAKKRPGHYFVSTVIAILGVIIGTLTGEMQELAQLASASLYLWSVILLSQAEEEITHKVFPAAALLFFIEIVLRYFVNLPYFVQASVACASILLLGYIIFWEELVGKFLLSINRLNEEAQAREEAQQRVEKLNKDLSTAYDTTLEGWARALELRDKETEGHSRRVTALTVCIAKEMGLSSQELVDIRYGALLHDIGKMAMPDDILHKPGPLTQKERDVINTHPVVAYNLLKEIDFLIRAVDIPYAHHERWDGNGYPRGLKGEQIPLAARIFTVADVWDAILNDRPYQKARSKDVAISELKKGAGIIFDPNIVEIFLAFIGRKGEQSLMDCPDSLPWYHELKP